MEIPPPGAELRPCLLLIANPPPPRASPRGRQDPVASKQFLLAPSCRRAETPSARSVFQVLVQAHAVTAFEDAGQRRLAHLDGPVAQVRAVKLQQVEGVEERPGLVRRLRSTWKAATPRSSQHTTSPSSRQDLTFEVVHGFDHKRKARRPVVAAAGAQTDAEGVAPGHEPITVVLDFVQPAGTERLNLIAVVSPVGGPYGLRIYVCLRCERVRDMLIPAPALRTAKSDGPLGDVSP